MVKMDKAVKMVNFSHGMKLTIFKTCSIKYDCI